MTAQTEPAHRQPIVVRLPQGAVTRISSRTDGGCWYSNSQRQTNPTQPLAAREKMKRENCGSNTREIETELSCVISTAASISLGRPTADTSSSTMRAGFTTARDVENQGSGCADVALRDAINQGLVEGPRMQVAIRAIAAVGQYNPFGVSPDLTDFPTGAQMVSGVEEAQRACARADRSRCRLNQSVTRLGSPHAYHRGNAGRSGRSAQSRPQSGRARLQPEGISNALNAGVDSIEHGNNADPATLQLMKQKNAYWVLTKRAISGIVSKPRPTLEYANTARTPCNALVRISPSRAR